MATEQDAGRVERLRRASHIATLISDGKLDEATDFIRPSGAISAGSDVLPEAISRFFADQGLEDASFLIALVEDVIMGLYPRTVIPDMAAIGYSVDEVALTVAARGCHAYAGAIRADGFGRKYAISLCSCKDCKRLAGKTFSLGEAKIGKTLPPFSETCLGTASPV